MESPSIALGCAAIIEQIARLSVTLPMFVSNVRIARKDMDALWRELTSLQLGLNALKDDDQTASVAYPPALNTQIYQVLANTESVVRQISFSINKLPSRNSASVTMWSITERQEIVRCRSVLECNRLALDLAVTMATISKLLDQRRTVLDRLEALDRLSEGAFKNQNHGVALIPEQDLGSSSDRAQVDHLRHEIADFYSQLSDLSNANFYENMQIFHGEAGTYVKSLLQPYPSLSALLRNPKTNSSLSPSTSISTATSSAVFTPRSHSITHSTTSTDSRLDRNRCPACARPLTTDDQEATINAWHEKQETLHLRWQQQLEKQKIETVCLSEEVGRLQNVNNALESGRVDDLDRHVDEIVKEKDLVIEQLRGYLEAAAFYAEVEQKGLEGTIETVRAKYANWEKRASTFSVEKSRNDKSMSICASMEDGSDATTIEHPGSVVERSVQTVIPHPPVQSSYRSPREFAETVVFEFSVNFVKDDVVLRSLTGRHQTLSRPVIIHAYKSWAKVDAVIREIFKAATGQSQPPKATDAGAYYLTRVTQRYDNDERPIVHVQPLGADQMIVNLHMLPGDKIRLMYGPPGLHLASDPSHSRQSSYDSNVSGTRQRTVMRRDRKNMSSLDEGLPEVTTVPSRSPNISPTSTNTDFRPGSISPHVRSDSMNSYLLPNPNIVVSKALSDHSGVSAETRISQSTGTLHAIPLFEFRADKVANRIRLKPRSLITNHNSYYSSFEPPSPTNTYQEIMLTISQHVSSDPVHFRDEDIASGMRHYIIQLLDPLLRHWECDPRRIFLQVRSTMIHDTIPLRSFDIMQDTSVWVMLKPFKVKSSNRSSLGISNESDQAIPADHELDLRQPDLNTMQRMSFNDANFRRIIAQRKHESLGMGGMANVNVRS